MRIFSYSKSDAREWDEFVARVPMATFLHTRSYLSHHGDRFKDVSLMIKDDKNRLAGLLPAAVNPVDQSQVVSHPGITYGGLLHQGNLGGNKMVEALLLVQDFYARSGFKTLSYKAIPYIYHQAPAADDIYGLFRLGGRLCRCDLSCAIDLDNRRTPSERRKRGLKKALKSGLQVAEGVSFAEPLWKVVTANLAAKYKLRPVHTVDEIRLLHSLFPEHIEFVAGLLASEVVAGVVLFESAYVVHAQYAASSATGQEVCALDAVFEYCLEKAKHRHARYFNFGVSTEDNGQYLNSDLYQFKSEFGAGGVVHDFYELDLSRTA